MKQRNNTKNRAWIKSMRILTYLYENWIPYSNIIFMGLKVTANSAYSDVTHRMEVGIIFFPKIAKKKIEITK